MKNFYIITITAIAAISVWTASLFLAFVFGALYEEKREKKTN